MPAAPLSVTDVAVAVVRDGDGRVLLAERTRRQVAAGYWELPGGKIDPGETAPEAATRELEEEIGIRAHALRRRITYSHAFRTKLVRLHFFAIEGWSGTPRGCEGQRLAWVDPAHPAVAPLLPSNARILGALALEAGGVVCEPERHASAAAREALVRDGLARGARFVVVREAHLGGEAQVAFARRAGELAEPMHAKVFVTGTALDARRAGAHGLLSGAAQTQRMPARPNVPLWAATVASPAELERAVTLGADLAVFPATLGSGAARSVAEGSPVPVFVEDGSRLTAVSRAS